ncbi:MAG TPA: ATP-binding protein [Phycisphaerae bacterium]|nr:ATP-binding protein [Phycisphaerae bacterium]HRY69949.1 ATP-binding protein [Phycisphaerae bacterium]HSA27158.1 ATP-binding protein [Phycisphaerae bacterium]
MRSIRARLLVGTVISAALVLSVAGLSLYWMVRASLIAEFDAALADKARTLAAMAEIEDGRVELDIRDLDMPEFRRADRPEYLQVWGPDGQPLFKSPSLGHGDLEKQSVSLDSPRSHPTVLPDGQAGRTIGVAFQPRSGGEDGAPHPPPPDGPWLTLALSRHTQEIDAVLARLWYLLMVVGGAAVMLTSAILVWVVDAGLRPLRGLASRIGQLGVADLSARVEMPDAAAELVPISDRLNDLLARLQAGFLREKAFAADVAHELRTPLAGLRSTLEVSLSRSREPDAYRIAIQESLAITRQMQAMVQNLLCLARLEAGQVQVVREPVDLATLLHECWEQLAQQATERELRIEWHIRPSCVVETDPDKLRQVFQNLLDNAVHYTDRGGSIDLQAATEGSGVRVEITNTGCRLSPQDAERVFDRLWRGDANRRDTGAHCGLGLSLARRMVTLLGGDIRVECTTGGCFRVQLSIGSSERRLALAGGQ